jgi:Tfp pilus assembly protein PilN
MIEVNLIPEGLRKKKRSSSSPAAAGGSKSVLFLQIGTVVFFYIIVHALLHLWYHQQAGKKLRLKREWDALAGQKKEADDLLVELKDLQAKKKSIEEVTGLSRILWAQKLNEISNELPRGVWLKEISFDEGTFLIHGSAISRHEAEMLNVHKFLGNLKKNKSFQRDFSDIDLGVIKSREIENTPVADFTIILDLKKPKEIKAGLSRLDETRGAAEE